MNAQSILEVLHKSANFSIPLNLIMHLLIVAAIVVLFFVSNSRLKRYVVDSVLVILPLSVAVLSIVNGNPFNFITFVVLSIIGIIELFQGKNQVERPKISFNTIICLVFIFIGFWYPEFTEANYFMMLFVSPVGVIPCPTLLTVVGMINLLVPKVSKLQFIFMALMAVFYGVVGVFVLKVYLDITLLLLAIYTFINFRLVFAKKSA